LSQMTVKEVIQKQREYKRRTWKVSAAIWAYQFMDYTLNDMIRRWIIGWNELFTPEFQDKIATYKLVARWLKDFLTWRLTKEQFAHSLSQEWASLPDPYNWWKSHYDNDWINHALVSQSDLYAALDKLKSWAKDETINIFKT
jgi:muramidase (phage lysozyme)